ncbi:hypothetical protein [uncultured Algibacter sp.]|uniref:hypothetical protein n=1 Tax=uncultured Algibacter sp. TaxID=298659 RepID=UPI003216CF80
MNNTIIIDNYNNKNPKIIKWLKLGIWLYFLLLIFEGALRKWVLPGLQAPLLIVRDPVAIWLIYMSWKHNISFSNIYIYTIALITVLGTSTALVFGHGNLFVAIYGARILLIHFPVMFIIGAVFNKEDVIKIGRVLLFITIPMTVLVALQFYSPQSAWVNRGIGGNTDGAGFSGALGYFRPPGTFSFITGNVLYYSFVACFVFYFWLSKDKINRLVLIGATIGVIASIPLSISRTLLFSVVLTLIFTLISVASSPKFLMKMVLFVVLGMVLILLLSNTLFFHTATEAFSHRFEVANTVEGGVSSSILDRFFGGMFTAISDSGSLPFFGFGLGMGTNAGSFLLTGGTSFLIAEGEWLRLVGELGFVMGIIVILIRVVFCASIFFKGYGNLKYGNLLPWILLSSGLLVILQGQWAQPTVLGFSTLLGGLILASSKLETSNNNKI